MYDSLYDANIIYESRVASSVVMDPTDTKLRHLLYLLTSSGPEPQVGWVGVAAIHTLLSSEVCDRRSNSPIFVFSFSSLHAFQSYVAIEDLSCWQQAH